MLVILNLKLKLAVIFINILKIHISNQKTDEFKYKLIHTPKQTVWANRPHKYQTGYKVFISTTTYYGVFVDKCGMTQSIAFIRCDNKKSK